MLATTSPATAPAAQPRMWHHQCFADGGVFSIGAGEPCSWCGAEQRQPSRYDPLAGMTPEQRMAHAKQAIAMRNGALRGLPTVFGGL